MPTDKKKYPLPITPRNKSRPTQAPNQSPRASPHAVEEGIASWYGPGFHGRKTASGVRFNQRALTSAHRRLPFGTLVKMTNLRNERWVIVTVNDRGPYVRPRIIDLSRKAAEELDMLGPGTTTVRIERL